MMSLQPDTPRFRRACAVLAVAALALSLPACEGGHFCVFGYSSRPNYNRDIHTVYVPIFKNKTFRRGLEFDLTRLVVREIEEKTPYKVVSNCESADTELIGTIISVNKALVNLNPENEIREGEMTIGVEVIWRDRRTGEILSKPSMPRNILAPGTVQPGDLPHAGPALDGSSGTVAPTAPIPLGGADLPPPYLPPDEPIQPQTTPVPVLIQAMDHNIPELGQSTATAMTGGLVRIATQVVSMMETPW
jgi:hypothetical protein